VPGHGLLEAPFASRSRALWHRWLRVLSDGSCVFWQPQSTPIGASLQSTMPRINIIYVSFAQDTVVDVEQFLTLVSTALAETALGSPKTPNSLPLPGNWAQLQLK